MRLAVVGATGLVGREILKVLEESRFPLDELIPVASQKSAGSTIEFNNKSLTVKTIEEALAAKPDIALFSAGGETSLKFAPKFNEVGTRVIDNSSAWRMHPEIKLIVPEVNGHQITAADMLIANPNCSTIQMVMVLHPLHQKYGIKRVVVSTYQSITGTGKKAVTQLENEYQGIKAEMAYHYPIHRNAIPHCDVFQDNGYTKEEMKLIQETQKILNNNTIAVTATAVRVPVVGGHSESVNISFIQDFKTDDVKAMFQQQKGIILQDNPTANVYPMPIFAQGKNEVFVGRIRRDLSQENSLNLWIVADNLRKGAATNAIQIADLVRKFL
ncbi:MAG: aspartate-semialdehyde dehydrogenase [Flavobacteriaceae bacterium]|nr:aspartate-semialdehyde dehydrogenase [Flavobacteriaceae bacterium]